MSQSLRVRVVRRFGGVPLVDHEALGTILQEAIDALATALRERDRVRQQRDELAREGKKAVQDLAAESIEHGVTRSALAVSRDQCKAAAADANRQQAVLRDQVVLLSQSLRDALDADELGGEEAARTQALSALQVVEGAVPDANDLAAAAVDLLLRAGWARSASSYWGPGRARLRSTILRSPGEPAPAPAAAQDAAEVED